MAQSASPVHSASVVLFGELSNFSASEIGLGISPLYPMEKIAPGLVQIHRNDFYLVIMVQQGSCRIEANQERLEVLSGSFLFVPKSLLHTMQTNVGTKGYFLAFTESFLSQQLNLDYLSFGLLKSTNRFFHRQLEVKDFQQLDELVRYLLQEYNQLNYPLKLMAMKFRLGLVLIYLEKCIQDQEANLESNIMEGVFTFKAFERLAGLHFAKEKSVDFYGNHLGISTKKLNDLVKVHANTTTLDYLNEHVVMEAKRLLLFTDMPVKGIAYELGFSSDSYFNRFFRKYESMSAQNFREKYRNMNGL